MKTAGYVYAIVGMFFFLTAHAGGHPNLSIAAGGICYFLWLCAGLKIEHEKHLEDVARLRQAMEQAKQWSRL